MQINYNILIRWILLTVLVFSLISLVGVLGFQNKNFVKEYRLDNEYISEVSNVLNEEFVMKIEDDLSTKKYKSKTWNSIVGNNFFKTAVILDAQNRSYETNLPGFLTVEKGQKFLLQAISRYKNENRAILIDNTNNKNYIIKEGEEIEGYIVVAIREKSVILKKDKEKLTLDLGNERGD